MVFGHTIICTTHTHTHTHTHTQHNKTSVRDKDEEWSPAHVGRSHDIAAEVTPQLVARDTAGGSAHSSLQSRLSCLHSRLWSGTRTRNSNTKVQLYIQIVIKLFGRHIPEAMSHNHVGVKPQCSVDANLRVYRTEKCWKPSTLSRIHQQEDDVMRFDEHFHGFHVLSSLCYSFG